MTDFETEIVFRWVSVMWKWRNGFIVHSHSSVGDSLMCR